MTTTSTYISPTTMENRRDEIQRILEDQAVCDHMNQQHGQESKLRRVLGKSMNPTNVERALELRQACRHYLTTALAMSERVFVRDGVVVVIGSQNKEFARVLSRFNHVQDQHGKSLAALYLNELMGGVL